MVQGAFKGPRLRSAERLNGHDHDPITGERDACVVSDEVRLELEGPIEQEHVPFARDVADVEWYEPALFDPFKGIRQARRCPEPFRCP